MEFPHQNTLPIMNPSFGLAQVRARGPSAIPLQGVRPGGDFDYG